MSDSLKKLQDFYSRPCGRGDAAALGRTEGSVHFYSRPCGRGDVKLWPNAATRPDFYSRPCGRGDRHTA